MVYKEIKGWITQRSLLRNGLHREKEGITPNKEWFIQRIWGQFTQRIGNGLHIE